MDPVVSAIVNHSEILKCFKKNKSLKGRMRQTAGMENAGLGCLSLVDLGAGESRLFCQLELRDCMELSFTAGYAFTHCCVC